MKIIKPNFWSENNIIVYILLPLTLITKVINYFKKKNKKKFKPKIPTICVGNIYIGGTGKTQLVLKLNQFLKKKFKTYVIKKNYENQIDEQMLIKKSSRLLLSYDRIDAIKKINKYKNTLAILDDGLQDKSLKYKISIACFNSFTGVGNGRLLPAGPLREDLSELKNYNAVFINGSKNNKLIKEIKKHNKQIKFFVGKYVLRNKKDFNKKTKYLAFCGIGTPESFFDLLRVNKINIKKKLFYPDHYNYKISDIKKIKNISKKYNYQIVTTEKDFMKTKKFKFLYTKHTKVDLYIKKYSKFKKFIFENL